VAAGADDRLQLLTRAHHAVRVRYVARMSSTPRQAQRAPGRRGGVERRTEVTSINLAIQEGRTSLVVLASQDPQNISTILHGRCCSGTGKSGPDQTGGILEITLPKPPPARSTVPIADVVNIARSRKNSNAPRFGRWGSTPAQNNTMNGISPFQRHWSGAEGHGCDGS
jgi:hypothetical protein